MPAWKTIRVFISSTFRDMHAERDWLVKRVFPALRQRLEAHRIHLVDIDLRWGITREQSQDGRVLALCLAQIEECRPFFLGLLGERYGWVPTKFSAEVRRGYGWTQHLVGKSVTELEILHGVLNEPAMHGRALFAFRSPEFLSQLHEEQRAIYGETPTEEELHELSREEAQRRAAHRREQLESLKERIRKLPWHPPLLDGYSCTWNDRVTGLEAFGNWVRDELEKAILGAPELQDHLTAVATAQRDPVAEERDFHERFIERRTRVYVGRESLQEEILKFVEGNTQAPCLVVGRSGSGKSAALAKFCQSLDARSPRLIVIPHFVGASPRSTGVRDLLLRLCWELKRELEFDDKIKDDMRELPSQFRDFLAKVPTSHRCVLVLDALNQLDDTENAQQLSWLPWPTQLPPQVRLIVSCIDDPDRADQPVLTAMRNRSSHEIQVPPLADHERRGILREVPSLAAKTLDDSQIDLLLRNEATRNPLFLLVALEELRGFGSFEQLNKRIGELPHDGDTLTILFQQVITRLCADFEAATVKGVLTFLACARRGLSERELLDLIEGESVKVEDSASDLFYILRQLRPYLQIRGQLYDFFHRHLAKAAHETFFQAEADRLAVHRHISDYFEAQPWFLESIEEQRKRQHRLPVSSRPVQMRKVDELPWQRLQTQDWVGTESLLTNLDFVEAKTESGLARDLLADFRNAVEALPPARPMRRLLSVLEETISREFLFLDLHPTTVFQCLWNGAWWYDCPAANQFYIEPQGGWPPPGAPWEMQGPKLHAILEDWREKKSRRTPGFSWLRSCWPSAIQPGVGLFRVLRSGDVSRPKKVVISPGADRFAAIYHDQTVVWEIGGGEPIHLQETGWAVAFSNNSRFVAIGAGPGLSVIDLATRQSCAFLGSEHILALCFSPNDHHIVVASTEDIALWEWRKAPDGGDIVWRHSPSAGSIAFSPDGETIAAGLSSKSLCLLDGGSGSVKVSLPLYEYDLTFAPNSLLIAGRNGDFIRVHETTKLDEAGQFGPISGSGQIAFSADSREIIWIPDADEPIVIWKVQQRNEEPSFRHHPVCQYSDRLASSVGGEVTVVAGESGTCFVWQTREVKRMVPLIRLDAVEIHEIRFLPHGSYAYGWNESKLAIWHAESGRTVLEVDTGNADLRNVQVSVDEQYVSYHTGGLSSFFTMGASSYGMDTDMISAMAEPESITVVDVLGGDIHRNCSYGVSSTEILLPSGQRIQMLDNSGASEQEWLAKKGANEIVIARNLPTAEPIGWFHIPAEPAKLAGDQAGRRWLIASRHELFLFSVEVGYPLVDRVVDRVDRGSGLEY